MSYASCTDILCIFDDDDDDNTWVNHAFGVMMSMEIDEECIDERRVISASRRSPIFVSFASWLWEWRADEMVRAIHVDHTVQMRWVIPSRLWGMVVVVYGWDILIGFVLVGGNFGSGVAREVLRGKGQVPCSADEDDFAPEMELLTRY